MMAAIIKRAHKLLLYTVKTVKGEQPKEEKKSGKCKGSSTIKGDLFLYCSFMMRRGNILGNILISSSCRRARKAVAPSSWLWHHCSDTPHVLQRTGRQVLTFLVTGERLSTAKINHETQLWSTACGNYFSSCSLPFCSGMIFSGAKRDQFTIYAWISPHTW